MIRCARWAKKLNEASLKEGILVLKSDSCLSKFNMAELIKNYGMVLPKTGIIFCSALVS